MTLLLYFPYTDISNLLFQSLLNYCFHMNFSVFQNTGSLKQTFNNYSLSALFHNTVNCWDYAMSDINEYGALVEWYWQKSEVLREKPAPVPLHWFLSHIDCSGIEPGAYQWGNGNYCLSHSTPPQYHIRATNVICCEQLQYKQQQQKTEKRVDRRRAKSWTTTRSVWKHVSGASNM